MFMRFIDWLNEDSNSIPVEMLKTIIVFGSLLTAIVLGGIAS